MGKKFMKAKIDLPKEVEEYLRKNASKLLKAPSGYVLDVFNMVMGYGVDHRNNPQELEVLSTLLKHFESEANGETKMGIQGVIEGGKGKRIPKPKNYSAGQINGVIADIRLFTDIPAEEATIKFEDDKGHITELRALADFILDGEMFMVAYYEAEDCISFFDLDFDENGMAVVTSVQDDDKFELLGKIWDIIEEADKDDVQTK